MTVRDKSTTYRDATYSADTQGTLLNIRGWLLTGEWSMGDTPNDIIEAYALALTDVTDRWDANGATETTFPA